MKGISAWSNTSAAIFLGVILAGCNLDFALPEDEVMHLSVYKIGVPTYSRNLAKDNLMRIAIDRWFKANPSGWEYGFVTRDPNICVKGQNFSINILPSEVSVKYCRGFLGCHYWQKKDGNLNAEIQKLISPAR